MTKSSARTDSANNPIEKRDYDGMDGTGAVEPYKVVVSVRFIVLTMMAACLGAFAAGQLARFFLLGRDDRKEVLVQKASSNLPPPFARGGKHVPRTVYTSKNFDTARSASSSLLIRRDDEVHPGKKSTESCHSSDGQSCRANAREISSADGNEEHLPAGQHLLVDMNGIDSSFLNSEERLAHAMIQVVDEASLTLLSYHCHALFPSGVSCVGVLLESHVSFHTWPGSGVITLDLFTCGSNPLLPVVPIIERLFGIPASREMTPKVKWSHTLRGFRKERNAMQTWDMGVNLLGNMDLDFKKEVRSSMVVVID